MAQRDVERTGRGGDSYLRFKGWVVLQAHKGQGRRKKSVQKGTVACLVLGD